MKQNVFWDEFDELNRRVEALERETAQQRIKREGFTESEAQEIIDSEPEDQLLPQEDIDEIPMEDGGGYALDDSDDYEEIKDVILGGEDCSHCDPKPKRNGFDKVQIEAQTKYNEKVNRIIDAMPKNPESPGDEAGGSPADRVRKKYYQTSCFFNFQDMDFNEMDYGNGIDLNGIFPTWFALMMTDEENFSDNDFTYLNDRGEDVVFHRRTYNIGDDAPFRFRWNITKSPKD
jgi:hypothetical protein